MRDAAAQEKVAVVKCANPHVSAAATARFWCRDIAKKPWLLSI
jgi:hypothetical protein